MALAGMKDIPTGPGRRGRLCLQPPRFIGVQKVCLPRDIKNASEALFLKYGWCHL